MSVDLPLDNIIGLIAILGGGGWLATANGGKLLKWFRSRKPTASTPGDDGHNSDAAPPECFCEHVEIIVAAAHTAPADVLIEYCREGWTEAQVLLAERDRLEALVAKDVADGPMASLEELV